MAKLFDVLSGTRNNPLQNRTTQQTPQAQNANTRYGGYIGGIQQFYTGDVDPLALNSVGQAGMTQAIWGDTGMSGYLDANRQWQGQRQYPVSPSTQYSNTIAGANALMDEQTSLTRALQVAPNMGGAENREMSIANNTYDTMLKNTQLNVLNQIGQQGAGTMSQLAAGGISTSGAGAMNLMSGIAAKGQASLNEYASQQAQGLLGQRQQLLSDVYTRLVNRTNATMATQAQKFSQAQQGLQTALGIEYAEAQKFTDVQSYNYQLEAAEEAGDQNMISGIISGGLSLLGGLF